MAQAFITGVAGFLGSNLATLLMQRGWSVWGIDNFVTSDPENVPSGVLFQYRSITDKVVIPDKTDVVFHTAAIARSAWPNSEEIRETNIWGSLNVFEAAEGAGARIVNCSSCVSAMPWLNDYAESKWSAEKMASDFKAISLRFSNIYGIGQSQKGAEPNVLASWVKQRKENGWIRVDGDGTQTRDFIHVRDAATACIHAAWDEMLRGKWVDICTGVQTPLIDIARRFNCEVRFAERRKNDPFCIPQDPLDAAKYLKFWAWTPLGRGLEGIV